jgi:cytochrome c-type biogenesis protein CcmH/NrfG
VATGVIRSLGADGSVPFEDASRQRRLSDRAVVALIAGALLLCAAAAGGILAITGHSAARSTAAPTASASGTTPSTTQDGRDLSQVSNDEMETVIAANPDVVPMRLALVERYLKAADGEATPDGKKAQLQRAQFHAGEAAARATTTADQARALRYLGWTTALLSDPAKGAGLLEQSLVKEPGNPDALWFLATVRFDKLNDPAAAKPLLEQLLASPVDDAQRQAVQSKLDKVNTALASGAPPASS